MSISLNIYSDRITISSVSLPLSLSENQTIPQKRLNWSLPLNCHLLLWGDRWESSGWTFSRWVNWRGSQDGWSNREGFSIFWCATNYIVRFKIYSPELWMRNLCVISEFPGPRENEKRWIFVVSSFPTFGCGIAFSRQSLHSSSYILIWGGADCGDLSLLADAHHSKR